jgi:acyl carrier protein
MLAPFAARGNRFGQLGRGRERSRTSSLDASTLGGRHAMVAEMKVVDLSELEHEIKKIIIDALMLEDTAPEDIETDAALFDSGLGLDSIDALEIAIALEGRFGVTVEDDPEKNQQIFASVRSLARFVNENRAG